MKETKEKFKRIITTAKSYFLFNEKEFQELLQDRYAVSSIDDLTDEQRHDLLEYFRSMGFGKPHKKWTCTFCAPRPLLVVPSGKSAASRPSPAQLGVINILTSNVVWNSPNGFKRWLSDRFGLTEIKYGQHASVIIMALKGVIRVQKKRCSGCQWETGNMFDIPKGFSQQQKLKD